MNNRTYISLFHTDPKTGLTKELKFPFDYINKVDVNLDLTVCTSETIRGKNKTDHAYMNQRTIAISGTFSERTVGNITGEFFNYKTNKLQNIQNLFSSFIKDVRLFYIYTRFKTYKNYVLKNCSLSYGDSISSIDVTLTFVEVMFRNNEQLYMDALDEEGKLRIMYLPPLTEASVETEESSLNIEFKDVISEYLPLSKSSGDTNLITTYNKISSNPPGVGVGKRVGLEVML